MDRKGAPDGNFFKISKRVLKSEEFRSLRPGSKILYMTLCYLRNEFGNKDGIFYRTDKALMIDSRLAQSTISESKQELIRAGLLRWKKGGPRRACFYQINDFET